ncbi:DmsC/YnfH family molybdoenzyme membrane anchor subunit [Candidatus Albibeggiatoa sp. nov. NOAA]|uniref:dimethyl sulfoxide reductase anchor subunit family protein n=1 Tax=Candidatus Albibeggiatoa sp. nov. NOAA TaxID=3162724 RepID=UPI0032F09F97|nr:dimethyl sulfoxide reductase anchor subunit [Thiotrichaceae bacterium]
MHPAFSVIFFTVTSGLGYGLMTLMVIAYLTGFGGVTEQSALIAGVAALVFITLGLLSSTLHLANPKNAIRAFSRFRTSWLSREGVFAVLFYPFALMFLFCIWKISTGEHEMGMGGIVAGIIAAILAMVTIFSTGMIYACLKTIRQWNTALTPANYMTLGLMLGALFLAAIQATAETLTLAMALIAFAGVMKLMYYAWIAEPAGSTINSATGFTNDKVRILEPGHTADTFLNHEFGHTVLPSKSFMLRSLVFILGFIIPFILVMMGKENMILIYAAVISAYAGILVERWLFFAEARHVVNLYHGAQRT